MKKISDNTVRTNKKEYSRKEFNILLSKDFCLETKAKRVKGWAFERSEPWKEVFHKTCWLMIWKQVDRKNAGREGHFQSKKTLFWSSLSLTGINQRMIFFKKKRRKINYSKKWNRIWMERACKPLFCSFRFNYREI